MIEKLPITVDMRDANQSLVSFRIILLSLRFLCASAPLRL